MKIGVFDSGLGGLIIMRALVKKLPQYDFVYLGDTKRVPYGNRTHQEIEKFTQQGTEFLFKKDCGLVIVACNTASSQALREIQQKFLPKKYPDKKVLGVLIPAAEEVAERHLKNVAVIGTNATIGSKSFERELKKSGYKGGIVAIPTPVLVPLIENDKKDLYEITLRTYLKPLQKAHINGIILGCTHYPLLKKEVKNVLGSKIKIFSQDEIIPGKLKQYLKHHPEIEKNLSRKRTRLFFVTSKNHHADKLGAKWFGHHVKLNLVRL